MGPTRGMARGVTRGDVRLYRFPPPDKQRPVVVLTRTSALTYLHRVTIAPITSTIRGAPTEVVLDTGDGLKATCAVNLDHVVTVPRAGLGRWLTTLRDARMREVCMALEIALGCDPV